MGCGAACICMIAAYYKNKLNYSDVDQCLKNTAQGVSVLAIESVLTSYHFKSESILANLQALEKLTLPVILHWNQNHFVVLFRISCNCTKFHIADPGKGIRVCELSEFIDAWGSTELDNHPAGVVIKVEPTKLLLENKAKQSTNIPSLQILWKYFSKYKRHFFQIIIGLLLGSVLQIIMPFLTQSIVDIGIKHKNISFIWLVLIGELMIVGGRTASDFIRRWLLLHISMRINLSLVSDFFLKLLKLPMSYFDSKLMGDMLQRINDHSRVESFLTGQTLGILFSMFTFVVLGIVLLLYDKLIFGVFLTGSMIYGIWIVSFLRHRKVLDHERFEALAINQDKVFQFVTSMQEIKLQNCERRRRWEWEESQANLFLTQMKALKLQQMQEAGSVVINEVKNIIITVLAATAVIQGHLTLGAMLAIQYIIGQLNSPVEQFMNFIFALQDVKIALERIGEIHCTENEESSTNVLTHFQFDKSIVLRRVSFKYNRFAQNFTINNVSFEIPYGKVTAIVGASGSGKTTLLKLLLGYYSVSEGQIDIGGNNINSYSLKWWRSHCGVVMQDGVIFSESILRNIAVDDNEIDKHRAVEAAKVANIHDFISTLPLGYDTIIGRSGTGLSQGQKQRILIARAVYKNPDFIFFDEATNALDAENEKLIVTNLNRFYKGRTVVVVAHRLSTVMNADQIIVLDGGRISEIGTHESLIVNRGIYYNLVRNQLSLGV